MFSNIPFLFSKRFYFLFFIFILLTYIKKCFPSKRSKSSKRKCFLETPLTKKELFLFPKNVFCSSKIIKVNVVVLFFSKSFLSIGVVCGFCVQGSFPWVFEHPTSLHLSLTYLMLTSFFCHIFFMNKKWESGGWEQSAILPAFSFLLFLVYFCIALVFTY